MATGSEKFGFSLALGAIGLLDLPFDRQAVAVPARHVVAVVPQHLLALHHEILEDLVQRMPDVDVAVGVGRAIVQHELGPPLGSLADLPVKVRLLPPLEQLRLKLRQACPHRKRRLRQEQGLAPVASTLGRAAVLLFLGCPVPLSLRHLAVFRLHVLIWRGF